MSVEPVFYIVGSVVAAMAVILSFIGLKARGFPSRRSLFGLLVLFAAALIATSGLALAVARKEQRERLAEQAQAEREAEESPEPTPAGEAPDEDEPAPEVDDEAVPAEAPGETLEITADMIELLYEQSELTTQAGEVAINFDNPSPIPHDVVIRDVEGNDIAATEIFTEGSETITAELEAGEYEFYCSVPGHEEAGMVGDLIVE